MVGKRWLVGGLAVLLALAAIPVGAQGAATERVLIEVADGGRVQALRAEVGVRHDVGPRAFTADVPAAVLAALQRRPGVRVSAVPIATSGGAPALIAGGQGNGNGKGGKPGGGTTGRVYTPDSPVPWGIAATYNDPALTTPAGGDGLVVAVLDTGVAAHIDLAAAAQCVDFTNRKTAIIEGKCADGNGHGTHVTGTIVANGGSDGLGIRGMAPGASYFAYKVLSDRGSGYYDDIATAIRLAADRGANVITMSLGGSADSSLLRDAVAYAAGRGALVLAAAGNSGPNLDTISYPAAYADAVAVGALSVQSGVFGVTSFSSRGADIWDPNLGIDERELEVAAPGAGVESTYNDGGYAVLSGTSMATPHMAGLAVRAWQGSAAATRSWLQSRATQMDISAGQYTGTGYDPASGYGFPRLQ